jgi:hypothetical protein
VLVTRYRRVRPRSYRIANSGDLAQSLHLLHRLESGWTPAGAPEYGETDGYAEFVLELAGGSEVEVAFEEEQELSRSYQLVNLQDSSIELFIASGVLSDRQQELLRDIGRLRLAVEDTRRQIDLRTSEQTRIFSDQTRIVRNMENLDRNSTLYIRYADTLEAQEDRLAENSRRNKGSG